MSISPRECPVATFLSLLCNTLTYRCLSKKPTVIFAGTQLNMSNTDAGSTVYGESPEIGDVLPTLLEATTTTAHSTHKRKIPTGAGHEHVHVLTKGPNQKHGRDHNTTQRRHTPSSATHNLPTRQSAHRVPTFAALSAQLTKV